MSTNNYRNPYTSCQRYLCQKNFIVKHLLGYLYHCVIVFYNFYSNTDLGLISSTQIVSCSNDGQILLWHIEEVAGEGLKANVINKFEDSDYVYSLSVLTTSNNSQGWVSSGENTGIKIFEKDGKVSS